MKDVYFYGAIQDIRFGLARYSLISLLGWQDIKQKYRRSALGPFWVTISMGVTIATIGVVFGQLFGSPMRDFLPFLSVGLILWMFISSCMTEGAMAFIEGQGVIKQMPLPLSIHVFKVLWRNFLVLLHNIAILPVVFLITSRQISWVMLLSIVGFILVFLAMAWLTLFLAIVCTRFRDFPQIISSALQIGFYITPIVWSSHLISEKPRLSFLKFNPVFHMIEVVRAPLLGEFPARESWIVVSAIVIFGWAFVLAFYSKYKRRIAYWI